VDTALLSLQRGDHRVMSLILDGMDQSNCKLPHLGSQNSFPYALKQVGETQGVSILFLNNCLRVIIDRY
jgi:hypothetical protein